MTGIHSPRKRRRTSSNASLPTPPATDIALPLESTSKASGRMHRSDNILGTALHVLQTEATALTNITNLYATDSSAQEALTRSVHTIFEAQRTRNRLIVCGVGKSAFIAQKFVATCKSLSISASFLHACEAVHGDLGDVREGDVVLFVSYSGRTAELLNVLEYLPDGLQIMALTGQTRVEDCQLLHDREEEGILLPAPVHESEEEAFGVAAPTTTSTVALAVLDMLALTLAEQLHGARKREVFKVNHPGGAIGMSTMREAKRAKREEEDAMALELPSPSVSGEDDR